MFRLTFALLASALMEGGMKTSRPAPIAWPHRAVLTSPHQRPVAFRAYTLGGDLIITVDVSGRPTSRWASTRVRTLTARDTITAETPADFPLDLSKGPVAFVAEGADSLHLVVGRNPHGSVARVSATGRKFIVRLVRDRLVLDSR